MSMIHVHVYKRQGHFFYLCPSKDTQTSLIPNSLSYLILSLSHWIDNIVLLPTCTCMHFAVYRKLFIFILGAGWVSLFLCMIRCPFPAIFNICFNNHVVFETVK